MISKYQSRVPRGLKTKHVTVSRLRCSKCNELIEPGEGVVVIVELEEYRHSTEWVHESEE